MHEGFRDSGDAEFPKTRVLAPSRWSRRRIAAVTCVGGTVLAVGCWSSMSAPVPPIEHRSQRMIGARGLQAFTTSSATLSSHQLLSEPLPPPSTHPWAHATHLIMVAGHAVYTAASRSAEDIRSEDSWYLEPFQHGQLSTMIGHIKRGVELAAADNASLVIFSGGETRPSAGPRSEARSYWEAADVSALGTRTGPSYPSCQRHMAHSPSCHRHTHVPVLYIRTYVHTYIRTYVHTYIRASQALGWFGTPQVRERSVLEVYARDSFENLLFSICRWHTYMHTFMHTYMHTHIHTPIHTFIREPALLHL